MKLKYKIINKKNLYSGFFSLNKYEFIHKKHNGEWTGTVGREVFSGAHVSTLLPYDPIKNEIIVNMSIFFLPSQMILNKLIRFISSS